MTRPHRRLRGSAPLALRLRELREDRWPARVVTQRMLAEGLGGTKPLSLSSISAYENPAAPGQPPESRLRDYATFFATERSVEGGRGRLLSDNELTESERAFRDELYAELLSLSNAEDAPTPMARGTWAFPPGDPVRLICGRLENLSHPYISEQDPNYTELLSYADLDALVEVFGHIRMQNPTCDVRFVLAERATPDDLSAHLVLVGGVGLNSATRYMVTTAGLPIRQVEHPDIKDGEVFEVVGARGLFLPRTSDDPTLGLIEDVGLLARTANPTNTARTLTICSGVYSRGVLGAVRCLTDAELRDQNEDYLASRFRDASYFGVLMRVPVLQGKTLTPDLQNDDVRLFEWPDSAAANDSRGLERAG